MNRYDVFQLVQELGRLIAGIHDKTMEEVGQELVACGQRRLAEAGGADDLNQQMNGTAIPSPLIAAPVAPNPDNTLPSVATPTLTSTTEA